MKIKERDWPRKRERERKFEEKTKMNRQGKTEMVIK